MRRWFRWSRSRRARPDGDAQGLQAPLAVQPLQLGVVVPDQFEYVGVFGDVVVQQDHPAGGGIGSAVFADPQDHPAEHLAFVGLVGDPAHAQPLDLAGAEPEDLHDALRPLGLWRRRSIILPRFARAWLRRRPVTYDDVMRLPGCGKYAADR